MQNRTDRGWIKAGLAVLVAGVMGGGVLAVAGGSEEPRKIKSDGVAGTPAGAAESPTLPDPPKGDPEVGEKVEMGDDGGSVSVLAVEDNVSAGRLLDAGEGQKFVAAEVKGCSGPNEQNITFEPSYFLLRLDDGTIRDTGVGAKKPSLEGGKIPAGKCLGGWVTFTVPDGALPTGVIYDGSTRTTWTVPLPENAKPTTTTTMKPGATTSTTADSDDSDASDTTSTTRAKSTTSSTAKSSSTTATTAKKSTPTTARAASTTSTTKPTATTATTTRSSSGSTSTTMATKTTSTTAPAKPSTTTTTTDANVESDPADQQG
ncbi:MAG TPA: hypothetical protein VFS16_06070 [Acidimicrobiia bacterium]|nr:hypothetical protein [Acidimicrobiia bacterium]